MSRLIPREAYDSWMESGRPGMYDRAREKVSEILDGPWVDPLPDEVIEKLDAILEKADATLLE